MNICLFVCLFVLFFHIQYFFSKDFMSLQKFENNICADFTEESKPLIFVCTSCQKMGANHDLTAFNPYPVETKNN